jgi:hypothetical protein
MTRDMVRDRAIEEDSSNNKNDPDFNPVKADRNKDGKDFQLGKKRREMQLRKESENIRR